MCGIVGYLGNGDARSIVLKGLEKLEYRGYDSAGLALIDNSDDSLYIYKDKGRVNHLRSITDYSFKSNFGIGHTRWATHGIPNKENSHPHVSNESRFTIVHNGVIENYIELRDKYLSDVELKSETDTEIIAHLIELFLETSVESALADVLKELEGSYAVVVMDSKDKDKIYACKHKSPLLLGLGQDEVMVASDVMAFVGHCDKYIPLKDESIVVASKRDFNIFNLDLENSNYDLKELDDDYFDVDKGDYSHFMLKEIMEQPIVVRRIIDAYYKSEKINISDDVKGIFNGVERIYVIAAGTSMNAGQVGKDLFESFAGIPCEVHIASEFAYKMPIISNNPLFIFISQSGETADLRAALVKVRQNNYKSLTITNVKTSTLAREADCFMELHAGVEIAVASTKAYIAQITVLAILASFISEFEIDLRYELNKVAFAMENILEKRDMIEKLVEEKIIKRNCFYIGRGLDYYVSQEASLKLKEISYVQTEGFAAGELKHGTIALIEEGTPVIAIISQKNISKNTRSNLSEVISRGANKLVISTESVSMDTDEIILDDVYEFLTPLVTVIPTQFIAYYAALQRGNDIDKPRNLAKSVTVE